MIAPALRCLALPLIAMLIGACLPAGAQAAPLGAAPHLEITSLRSPTHFVADDESGTATYVISVLNVGAKSTDGSPITITDTLPAGISVNPEPGGFANPSIFIVGPADVRPPGSFCEVGPPVSCTAPESVLPPGTLLELRVAVNISPGASGVLLNRFSVSGGGSSPAAGSEETPISTEPADFGFQGLKFSLGGPDGAPFTQAGGHPYRFNTGFQLNTVFDLKAGNPPAGTPKNVVAKLPPGVVVNPQATPVLCTEAQLEAPGESKCPLGSVVGLVRPAINKTGYTVPAFFGPIYNMVPPPGSPASLAFNAAGLGIYVHLLGGVDAAGNYELTASARDILQEGTISGIEVELWGDPSDPSHDYRRGPLCNSSVLSEITCPTEPAQVPLLTMPTACSPAPLRARIEADSWENPGAFISGVAETEDGEGNPLGVEGCNALAFSPTISSQPTTNLADSPSGLEFTLHQPQNESLEGLATAALKDARITLPAGMSVNPSAANGLAACSNAQIGYAPFEGKVRFSQSPQSCPNAAKLGTLEVSTPLLDEKLPGAIYLAEPYENPFGSLLAIYLAIEDPQTGIIAKLAGKVSADPQTGQLTATFTDNPQLPIEDIAAHFFKVKAALKTSLTCGEYTTTSTLTPWSAPEGADATPSDSFETSVAAAGSGPCPTTEAQAPSKPSFTAGTLAPQAGAYSPFLLKLTRNDGTQRLRGIDATLPKGLTGKLAGIPYCSEAQIAVAKSREAPDQGALEQRSPSCPLASEVGSVTVGAGAGITPFYVGGHAYLAGPYKGAPISLVVIVPAVAGPFDLGAVVNRTALYVNSESAQIHAVSDPLPSIIQGIPLDLRSIALKLDRPNFTLNPTSCDPTQITGAATALTGQSAALTSPFQVGGCSSLKFKPKLAISLKGGTKRNKYPALRAVVTYPKKGRYANIASAQVTLPHSAFLEQAHIGTVCTRVQFAADQCPKASVYGFARAFTPLLDKPVEGPVYLRSSSHELPDLVAALEGQVNVDLVGRVDTGKGGGIRNTFEATPDAPVSKFVLEMKGGRKGLLVNSENICRKPQRALVSYRAHNGDAYQAQPLIRNDCGKKAKKKKKGKGKNAHRAQR